MSTQTVSTESAGTQTHLRPTLPSPPISLSVLSKDTEMQTSEPPSHDITREEEEEDGRGDKPDTLGPCVMDGCGDITYCDGPFSATPNTHGHVHVESFPAAKSGIGSGSGPGNCVPADIGFYPISESWLCSETRAPGDVSHLDHHMESLMASTLLNDLQGLDPLLSTSIGGQCDKPIRNPSVQRGSRERYDAIDQSSELKLPSNSSAQSHGKGRPLPPSELATTSMIWAKLERTCASLSKPCLKKQSSRDKAHYPRNRTNDAAENEILRDLFFV